MSDERVGVDGESEALLRELWLTPVGRRWVLKAGLGSAAAVAVANLRVWSDPAVAVAAKLASGSSVSTTLHFALGAATRHHGAGSEHRRLSDLVLVANGARLPLVPHTAATRRALKTRGGLWRVMDLSALTHYVPAVRLPADQAIVVTVYGRRRRHSADGRKEKHEVLVAQLHHVPPRATLRLATAEARARGSLGSMLGHPRRLRALGIKPSDVRSPADIVQLDAIVDSYQTAMTLTMLHPNVATKNSIVAGATKSLLGKTPAVTALGAYIAQMQKLGRDVATSVPATDRDGSPSQIKVGQTTTTFSTLKLNRDDSRFVAATKSAVSGGVRAVRNTGELGAVIDKPLDQDKPASTGTWVQPQGVTPQPQAYTPPLAAAAGLDIKVKNDGLLDGTYTVVNGGFAAGKVPLKIYNNYVRWVWVYVQYLGAGDKNLSLNPGATFPDTKYSQSLGLLPQVFTVLGIPLWDTNTIDVTLDFPEGAHTARLLYCGLGADIVGGGWRQYFPADAYPDRIAPTDEVLAPALITGIFTIGLNVFALATDIDIATTWAALKDEIFGATKDLPAVIGTLALTVSEATAVAVASGGAIYEDIAANHDDLSNLWSILLGLASVIPKLIFNPRAEGVLVDIGVKIVGFASVVKVLEAVPLIGEVLAVIEVVGDAVTLAEVAAETLASPWVIENEVTLTYQASITIARDPRASTFPVTAVSWRLEALVDGALTLDPITGQINAGGRIQSDPLALTVTAPFGGTVIQWSVVMLDAAGHQVGTGVSAQFPNDDPANPPSVVSFAIVEIPATITASTVFKRADTTTYSQAAGGYTWSDQVPDTGTVTGGGIQQVTGAAIATTLGVAGVVWKQGDRYWLRGVPVAENGTTITLGPVTRERYARRPFLLFDSFVGKGDVGNHVLLEPDETTDAYHVRMLSLDPVTGALSWDPTVSYGTFTLPVSAAALHSSGRVVALHTDTGRVGRIQPVVTPRPLLAAYSAGPGTEIGLLQSPTAVAVTNPGVVLVLEAGASQLAAFDLNGNPVRYFAAQSTLLARHRPNQRRRGAAPTLDFTLPLVSPGTYLDLAVDGASQIYVLYYTGDGSRPEDYRVDVYTQTGAPLDTHSPGVNVPHLAIDYWRSIYAANYDPLTDQGTSTPHIEVLGVAEPSLSRFDPTESAGKLVGARHRKPRRPPKRRRHHKR